MDGDLAFALFLLFIGLFFGFLFTAIGFGSQGIDISQATANDICVQLTGNETAIAKDSWDTDAAIGGKLICIIPSFDSTQNIIIKSNQDE